MRLWFLLAIICACLALFFAFMGWNLNNRETLAAKVKLEDVLKTTPDLVQQSKLTSPLEKAMLLRLNSEQEITEASRKQTDALQQANAELTEQIEALQATKDQYLAKANLSEQKVKETADNIANYEARIKDNQVAYEKELLQLEITQKELRENIAKLETARDAAIERVSTLNTALEKVENEKTELHNRLELQSAQNAQNTDTLGAKKSEIEEINARLTAERDDLIKQLEDAEAAHEEVLSGLAGENALRENLSALQTEKAELQERLAAAESVQQDIASKTEENNELKAKVIALEADKLGLKRNLQQADQDKEQTLNEISENNAAVIEALQAQVKREANKASAFGADLNSLRIAMRNQQEKFLAAEDTNNKLLDQLNEIRGATEAEQSQVSTLTINSKATLVPEGRLTLQNRNGQLGFVFENIFSLSLRYDLQFLTENNLQIATTNPPALDAEENVLIPFTGDHLTAVQSGMPIRFEMVLYNLSNERNSNSWRGQFRYNPETAKFEPI